MTNPPPPYGGPPAGPYPTSPWAHGQGIGEPQYPPYPQGPSTGAHQYPPTGGYAYPPPYPQVPQQRGFGLPPGPPRKRSKLPWVLGGVVLLVLVIGLANTGRGRQGSTPSARPTVAVAAPTPAALAPPAASSADSGVVGWGQRTTTEDGLAIEVAKPEAYKPSRSAAGNDRERAVKVTTTVVNGSSEPYELNTFIIGPNATHDGRPAPQVIDLGGDADIVPVTTVLPGKSFSYSTVFSIGAQEADLQLEYRQDFLTDPVIVVGTA